METPSGSEIVVGEALHDRSRWGSGPWDKEPDKITWYDKNTGLPCMVIRSSMGNLCGYAGVYKGHQLFTKDYSDCLRPGCRQKPRMTRKQYKLKIKQAKRHKDPLYGNMMLAGLRLGKISFKQPKGISSRHAYRYTRNSRACFCNTYNSPEARLDVHGGVTYSGYCHGVICHEPRPGERRVKWFGFDCAHSGDLVPSMDWMNKNDPAMKEIHDRYALLGVEDIDTYKNLAYVMAEAGRLAQQLKEYR